MHRRPLHPRNVGYTFSVDAYSNDFAVVFEKSEIDDFITDLDSIMLEPKPPGHPMMKNNFRYWVFPDFRSSRGRIQPLLSFHADTISFGGVQFEEVGEAKCPRRLGVIRLTEHRDGKEEPYEREKMGAISEGDGKGRGGS